MDKLKSKKQKKQRNQNMVGLTLGFGLDLMVLFQPEFATEQLYDWSLLYVKFIKFYPLGSVYILDLL